MTIDDLGSGHSRETGIFEFFHPSPLPQAPSPR